MLYLNKKGYFGLSLFEEFPQVVQGFSMVSDGDMSRTESRNTKAFLQKISPKLHFVKAEQIHAGNVLKVNQQNEGKVIPAVDGLFTQEPLLALTIRVADCLPIFVYDPEKQIIGAAHAGWRGTRSFIAKTLVKELSASGSKVVSLIVGFGPCIGPCHYEVKNDVASEFSKKGLQSAIIEEQGKYFLDLKKANFLQLIEAGIREENIDGLENICTFENQNLFSYRRTKSKQPNIGIIALI